MASPSRELVGVSVARLRATPAVTALVGTNIHYRAPEDAPFPHIADFDTSTVRDDATCVTGRQITMNVHVWTRDGIDPLQDARAIVDAVVEALHHAELPLPTNRLLTLNHRGDRIFYDPDGLTGHGVVEFRAIIQSIQPA